MKNAPNTQFQCKWVHHFREWDEGNKFAYHIVLVHFFEMYWHLPVSEQGKKYLQRLLWNAVPWIWADLLKIKKPFWVNSNSTVQPLYWILPSPPPASSKKLSVLQRKDVYIYLSILGVTLLSRLSLHQPADSTVRTKLPSVIYREREVCLELQDGALQDAWEETAALRGGRNLLPNIKLRRGAVVGFYATETNGGISNHEWLLHALGIMLRTTPVLSSVLVSYWSYWITYYSKENTTLWKYKCVSA